MPIQKPVTLDIYNLSDLEWNDPTHVSNGTSEYTERDYPNKNTWPDGPWLLEADTYAVHYHYPTLCLRNNIGGSWCGYIALPGNHAFYGCSYQLINNFVSCHGGLTYSAWNDRELSGGGVTLAGEKKLWIVGFDCAHSSDMSPGLAAVLGEKYRSLLTEGTYRNQDFIEKEVKSLADQLCEYDNQRMLMEVQPLPSGTDPEMHSVREVHFSFHDWSVDSHLWLGKPNSGRDPVILASPFPVLDDPKPKPESAFSSIKNLFLNRYIN